MPFFVCMTLYCRFFLLTLRMAKNMKNASKTIKTPENGLLSTETYYSCHRPNTNVVINKIHKKDKKWMKHRLTITTESSR